MGFVGTAAGLVSFLANTIESLDVRVRNYRECARRLEDFKHELETCLLELQGWLRDWCHSETRPYPEATYEYFWGRDGFLGIQRRLRNIYEETEAIVNLLECRDIRDARIDWTPLPPHLRNGPSRDELQLWTLLLNDDDVRSGRSRPRAATWMFKFFFALYKNGEILSKMVGLKGKIAELERHSRLRFWEFHDHPNVSSAIEPDNLRRLAMLQTKRQQLMDFLTDIYNVHRHNHNIWELILGEPKLAHAIECLPERMALNFGFLAKNPGENGDIDGHRFYVTYPRDSYLGGRTLLQRVQSWNQSNTQFLFTQPLQQARILRHGLTFGGNTGAERISSLGMDQITAYTLAALSTVQSAVLLYGSHWIHGLCLCRIQHTRLDQSTKILTLKPAAMSYAEGHCPHVHAELSGRVFLLLGVLLAELAVGASINISIQQPYDSESGTYAEPLLWLPDDLLDTRFTNPLQIFELLELIGEIVPHSIAQYVGAKYLGAMRYCFELSERLLRRPFRADDLESCLKKIVTP